jgi:hypothetical protein
VAKEYTGVRAKLNDYKKANTGHQEKTLPKSGIKVKIPDFMNHGAWMGAQRQAKGDTAKAQAAFVVGTVLFEDEKLTMADIQAGLIDASDMLFLIGEIFGDDDEGDDTEK